MLQTCKLVAALHSTLLLKFMSTQLNDMKFEDYYHIFRTCTPLVLVLFFIITLRISTVDRRLVQHAKLKKLQELNESSNAKNYHSINPRNRQIKVTVNRSMKCTNYFQQGWETTIKEMSATDWNKWARCQKQNSYGTQCIRCTNTIDLHNCFKTTCSLNSFICISW